MIGSNKEKKTRSWFDKEGSQIIKGSLKTLKKYSTTENLIIFQQKRIKVRFIDEYTLAIKSIENNASKAVWNKIRNIMGNRTIIKRALKIHHSLPFSQVMSNEQYSTVFKKQIALTTENFNFHSPNNSLFRMET